MVRVVHIREHNFNVQNTNHFVSQLPLSPEAQWIIQNLHSHSRVENYDCIDRRNTSQDWNHFSGFQRRQQSEISDSNSFEQNVLGVTSITTTKSSSSGNVPVTISTLETTANLEAVHGQDGNDLCLDSGIMNKLDNMINEGKQKQLEKIHSTPNHQEIKGKFPHTNNPKSCNGSINSAINNEIGASKKGQSSTEYKLRNEYSEKVSCLGNKMDIDKNTTHVKNWRMGIFHMGHNETQNHENTFGNNVCKETVPCALNQTGESISKTLSLDKKIPNIENYVQDRQLDGSSLKLCLNRATIASRNKDVFQRKFKFTKTKNKVDTEIVREQTMQTQQYLDQDCNDGDKILPYSDGNTMQMNCPEIAASPLKSESGANEVDVGPYIHPDTDNTKYLTSNHILSTEVQGIVSKCSQENKPSSCPIISPAPQADSESCNSNFDLILTPAIVDLDIKNDKRINQSETHIYFASPIPYESMNSQIVEDVSASNIESTEKLEIDQYLFLKNDSDSSFSNTSFDSYIDRKINDELNESPLKSEDSIVQDQGLSEDTPAKHQSLLENSVHQSISSKLSEKMKDHSNNKITELSNTHRKENIDKLSFKAPFKGNQKLMTDFLPIGKRKLNDIDSFNNYPLTKLQKLDISQNMTEMKQFDLEYLNENLTKRKIATSNSNDKPLNNHLNVDDNLTKSKITISNDDKLLNSHFIFDAPSNVCKGKESGKRNISDEPYNLTKDTINLIKDDLVNIKELCFCLLYQEGFTSFYDENVTCGSSLVTPESIAIRVINNEGKIMNIKVNIWGGDEQVRVYFMDHIFLKKTRKIVFNAKDFLLALTDEFPNLCTVLRKDFILLDPKVGCWLLRSDKPINTFRECVNLLAPREKDIRFGSKDCIFDNLEILSKITSIMFQKLNKDGLWDLFYRLEMKLLPLLALMQKRGVTINLDEFHRLQECFQNELKKLENSAQKCIQKEFNLSSSVQLRTILYDELQLDLKAGISADRTPNGAKSTCESMLQKLVACHPLPNLVLTHRHIAKCNTTYVKGILQFCEGGKVETIWDQIAAVTGRLTSAEPNLQAVPKTDILISGEAINLRSPYLATNGFVFLAADFEQIEFRIYGHLSGDPTLLSVVKEENDIFAKLSSVWQHKEITQVTTDEREKTKRMVYAIMYGAGKNRMADILGINVDQAANIMDLFYQRFSLLKSFYRDIISEAKKLGYLTTMFGRRRYFPQINSGNVAIRSQTERQAFNFLIQGSAADIAKTAMIQAEAQLATKGIESHLVLMIHDEIVWEVKKEDFLSASAIVRTTLQDGQSLASGKFKFNVPLPVKLKSGQRWDSLKIV